MPSFALRSFENYISQSKRKMKMFSPNVWQPSVLQEYESRAQINTLDIVYQAGAFQATNTKDEFTSIRHR